jgi:hypothetical protein
MFLNTFKKITPDGAGVNKISERVQLFGERGVSGFRNNFVANGGRARKEKSGFEENVFFKPE